MRDVYLFIGSVVSIDYNIISANRFGLGREKNTDFSYTLTATLYVDLGLPNVNRPLFSMLDITPVWTFLNSYGKIKEKKKSLKYEKTSRVQTERFYVVNC